MKKNKKDFNKIINNKKKLISLIVSFVLTGISSIILFYKLNSFIGLMIGILIGLIIYLIFNHDLLKKAYIVKIVLFLIGVFILINAIWFIWRTCKYNDYIKHIPKDKSSEFLVPTYVVNVEGYSYAVKIPSYLSTVGNLSVVPDNDEIGLNALIIWTNINGNFDYGVIIRELNKNEDIYEYQIYIDKFGKSINKEDKEIINKYQSDIDNILKKGKKFWNLNIS